MTAACGSDVACSEVEHRVAEGEDQGRRKAQRKGAGHAPSVHAIWGMQTAKFGLKRVAGPDGMSPCPLQIAGVIGMNGFHPTGACDFNGAIRISTYPVRVEAGEILVDLPDA